MRLGQGNLVFTRLRAKQLKKSTPVHGRVEVIHAVKAVLFMGPVYSPQKTSAQKQDLGGVISIGG